MFKPLLVGTLLASLRLFSVIFKKKLGAELFILDTFA